MLTDLFLSYNKCNGSSKTSAERFGGIPITYCKTNVTRTIAEDEWLTILDPFGKETPALIYHRVSTGKNNMYLRTTKQFGNHAERNTRDEIAKMINVDYVRVQA